MNEFNVCLINDSFPPAIDGVANAVVNYADVITRSHGKATVVTPFYPGADDSAFSFPVVRYPSVDMTRLVGYRAGIPFAPELIQELERSDFDIIHSHCPITSTIFARELRGRIDAPLVFTYHTKFDIDIANAVKSRLLREEAARLLVQNISACDEVWTVSRGAGENLRSLGYEGEWRVMPNGVDFPKGRVSPALVARATEGYDLPPDIPLFLFVGRMMWYKGIRIILDALKKLADSGADFRMVFVGGGNDKDDICAYCASLGLTGRVFFVPPIHDRDLIRAWYCRAGLFLFPSTFDTNGLVVREAAACALPSVLVAGSCAAEDVTDGVNGFLIRENAESLAAMLAELCTRPAAIKQAGANAQNQLYTSWESSVAAACARYETVIENYRRGLYAHRRDTFDELCGVAGRAFDSVYSRREIPQQAYARLLSELDALVSDIRGDIKGEQARVRERLEGLWQRIDRFL